MPETIANKIVNRIAAGRDGQKAQVLSLSCMSATALANVYTGRLEFRLKAGIHTKTLGSHDD